MENDNLETETEVETEETEQAGDKTAFLRDSLKDKLTEAKEEKAPAGQEEQQQETAEVETSAVQEQPAQQPEIVPMAPPADMNKAEKEAFLNPTPQNAHILQAYLNRRAYETRSDYSRKMQEVEQLKQQTSAVYDTIKQYEDEYAKQGISVADVAKRAVAWDKAMKQNPVDTAIEWLESYGVNLDDLFAARQQPQQGYQQNGYQNGQQQYYQTPEQKFLTIEEAERIAEEKYQALQQEQQKKAVDYYNQRVIESFITQKPLFKDPETAAQLEAEMAPVVQALSGTGRYSSPEEILETAYNYVVNGNPVFSSLVQKMAARPVIQQQQAVVEKAKAAAKSITGSAGSGTPRVKTNDLRENLRRRMGAAE